MTEHPLYGEIAVELMNWVLFGRMRTLLGYQGGQPKYTISKGKHGTTYGETRIRELCGLSENRPHSESPSEGRLQVEKLILIPTR